MFPDKFIKEHFGTLKNSKLLKSQNTPFLACYLGLITYKLIRNL